MTAKFWHDLNVALMPLVDADYKISAVNEDGQLLFQPKDQLSVSATRFHHMTQVYFGLNSVPTGDHTLVLDNLEYFVTYLKDPDLPIWAVNIQLV